MEVTRADCELPNIMAGLDIMEVDSGAAETENKSDVSQPSPQLRSLRKRKPLIPESSSKSANRRVCMKPKKRIMSENATSKQIEALYLNKTVKSVSQTLETIYEETKSDSESSSTSMGKKKVKRLLTFQLGNHYTKEKIKKRRAKIKKLLGSKPYNRKKIPMDIFLKTIDSLELDENLQSET